MAIITVENSNVTLVNVRKEDRHRAVDLVDLVIEEPDGYCMGAGGGPTPHIQWTLQKTRAGHVRIHADYREDIAHDVTAPIKEVV